MKTELTNILLKAKELQEAIQEAQKVELDESQVLDPESSYNIIDAELKSALKTVNIFRDIYDTIDTELVLPVRSIEVMQNEAQILLCMVSHMDPTEPTYSYMELSYFSDLPLSDTELKTALKKLEKRGLIKIEKAEKYGTENDIYFIAGDALGLIDTDEFGFRSQLIVKP